MAATTKTQTEKRKLFYEFLSADDSKPQATSEFSSAGLGLKKNHITTVNEHEPIKLRC